METKGFISKNNIKNMNICKVEFCETRKNWKSLYWKFLNLSNEKILRIISSIYVITFWNNFI